MTTAVHSPSRRTPVWAQSTAKILGNGQIHPTQAVNGLSGLN